MKCLNCNEEFVALSIIQKYCCSKCGVAYRKNHDIKKEYPSITFACAKCGKMVVTEGTQKDKRMRFCSNVCEKKFWRHPPWENPTNRVNFRSMEEYLSWERRTNG